MTLGEPPFPQTNSALPWYAIRVKSRCEHVVSAGLRAKGLEEYLPLYSSRRRWSDRQQDLLLPLFPGYVFCRLDAAKRQPVLKTPGVVSVLGFGKTPVPLAEKEVDDIRCLVTSGFQAEPWPFLQVGQRVRIQRGALEGVEGIVLKLKNSWRLIASVTLLQRSVATEIDRDWVCPI